MASGGDFRRLASLVDVFLSHLAEIGALSGIDKWFKNSNLLNIPPSWDQILESQARAEKLTGAKIPNLAVNRLAQSIPEQWAYLKGRLAAGATLSTLVRSFPSQLESIGNALDARHGANVAGSSGRLRNVEGWVCLSLTLADGTAAVWGLGIYAGALPELAAIASIPWVGWALAILGVFIWAVQVIWC
jgi:hypothetical protein